MANLKGVPVENINAGIVKLKRFPNGYVFWYYMTIKGVDVRIDKTLYKTIKKVLESNRMNRDEESQELFDEDMAAEGKIIDGENRQNDQAQ